MAVYDEKDYVEVVDADGNPVPGFERPVPKQWLDTPLLPPGTKKKSVRAKSGDKTEPEGS